VAGFKPFRATIAAGAVAVALLVWSHVTGDRSDSQPGEEPAEAASEVSAILAGPPAFGDLAELRAKAGRPLFGFVTVIGDALGVPGYVHDDRGPSPAVLAPLFLGSRADMLTIGGDNWASYNEGLGFSDLVFKAGVDPFASPDKAAVCFLYLAAPESDEYAYGTDAFWEAAERHLRWYIGQANARGLRYFVFENEPTMMARADKLEYYMERLRFAYRIAKDISPENMIIAGNLSDHAADHWRRIYELGFADFSDVIGYHPYSDFAGSGVDVQDIVTCHRVFEEYGDGDKPIFLGEGWGPKRQLPDLHREEADAPPSQEEIQQLRQFVVNGCRALSTPHEGYDPAWILGALFFTMNDNTGGEHWADRAVRHYDKNGQFTHWTVDGFWMGPELPPPAHYNGGVVTLAGEEKDKLLAAFPDGRLPGHATIAVTCDGSYELYLDGQPVGSASDGTWETNEVYLVEVGPGRHALSAVCAMRDSWPSGFMLDLRWGAARVVSDGDWRWAQQAAEGWRRPGFDHSAWAPVKGDGVGFHAEPWTYGCYGFVDSPATWIWPVWGADLPGSFYLRREFTL